MSGPNRYVQRVNGAFIDAIAVDAFEGALGIGQLVALNSSGYVDGSLIYSLGGSGVSSVNGITGAVIISGGLNVWINSSGQVVVINSSGGGGGTGSDLATRPCSFVPGKPAAGQDVMGYTAETTVVFPANFAFPQSYGSCGTPPASGAVYAVYKNATPVGTISVSVTGGFTFATTSGAQFALNAQDRLVIVAPAVQDLAMSDVSITLVGTRLPIPSGVAAPVFTWRGAYSNSTSYNPYDIVSSSGSSYICILLNTGNPLTNTTYWNLLAQGGTSGTAISSGSGLPASGFGTDGDYYIQTSGGGIGAAGDTGVVIDGGGSLPTTGFRGFRRMSYAGTIVGYTMLANGVGSAQITVSKGTYASFPTVTSIVASAPPVLTSAQKVTSTTLTGWTLTFAAGDILWFNLDSISGSITWLTLDIQIVR